MKEIWTKDVAEYHGKFVNFDPMWCWPKPAQTGGPPVLMGAWIGGSAIYWKKSLFDLALRDAETHLGPEDGRDE